MNLCILGAGEKTAFNDVGARLLMRGLPPAKIDRITNVDWRKLDGIDIQMNLDKYPWRKFWDGMFDIVVAEHLAEHLSDKVKFIQECRRILKPGGLLIMEVPNWSSPIAHNSLEHKQTFGRGSFTNYHTEKLFRQERIEFGIGNPITWKVKYVKNEFIGRNVDRFTNLVYQLRFYLRAI